MELRIKQSLYGFVELLSNSLAYFFTTITILNSVRSMDLLIGNAVECVLLL